MAQTIHPLFMLPDVRILVADDDAGLLQTVSEALDRLGARVVRAESGADLVERMANDGPFALIVTDISMPWMSGLQAMHTARYAGVDTPIIVMTALKDASIPESVRKLGRKAVLLRKPFDLAELETTAVGLVTP